LLPVASPGENQPRAAAELDALPQAVEMPEVSPWAAAAAAGVAQERRPGVAAEPAVLLPAAVTAV
jgi:hypothetical protein